MRLRRTGLAALAALALLGAACSDDGSQTSSGDGTVTTDEADRSTEAAYAEAGPYAVGLTTLQLADRAVEVLYPAAEAAGTPADVRGLEEGRQIFRDAPASDEGPFPVLLYSHAFGGSPLVSANLQSGIASWGFVVAAPDHIERNTAALGNPRST